MTELEFKALQSDEVRSFINKHKNEKAHELALKFSKRSDLPFRAIAEQIECIKKASKKLPKLAESGIIFTKRGYEQSSSEATADLKHFYLKGKSIADLTGGLGIDSHHFSNFIKDVTYFEQDKLLAEITAYNFNLLGKKIQVNNSNSVEAIKKSSKTYDWIYIDPDRRDKSQSRKISIEDYEPNVIEYETLFLSKASQVMIKVSPMVDLSAIRRELKSLDEFVVVSVDNECKEVWLILRNERQYDDVLVKALCYSSAKNSTFHIEKNQFSKYEKDVSNTVLTYLIEPDKAIIKARLTDKLAERHKLKFINANCDYLCSDTVPSGFPSRNFKVDTVLPFKKKTLLAFLKASQITKAIIARRNFPDSPDFLRKQFKLKDGGETYLFFTKNAKDEFIVIVAKRL